LNTTSTATPGIAGAGNVIGNFFQRDKNISGQPVSNILTSAARLHPRIGFPHPTCDWPGKSHRAPVSASPFLAFCRFAIRVMGKKAKLNNKIPRQAVFKRRIIQFCRLVCCVWAIDQSVAYFENRPLQTQYCMSEFSRLSKKASVPNIALSQYSGMAFHFAVAFRPIRSRGSPRAGWHKAQVRLRGDEYFSWKKLSRGMRS